MFCGFGIFCIYKKSGFRIVNFVESAGTVCKIEKSIEKSPFCLKKRYLKETDTYHFFEKCRQFVKNVTKGEKKPTEIVMKID